jgi:hypothetical protein
MGEKRGFTGKLKFDFNPLSLLEVQFNDGDETWYRVSAEYFRAFDGKRRITEPSKVVRGVPEVEMTIYEYTGPVYIWGTNTIVPKKGIGKVMTGPEYEAHGAASKQRGA